MSIYSTGINPLIQTIINTSNILEQHSSNNIAVSANYLQNQITNTSNILEQHSSNNIAVSANNLQTQITNTCNLIYKDGDLNTIVKLTAQNPLYPIGTPKEIQFHNVNGDYLTKITQTGELMVYHPAAPLPAGYAPSWWGVENKIANVITDSQGLRFDVTQLQAATGAVAITDTTAATAAAAAGAGGLASVGAATAASGAAIAGGDTGSVALGVAGGVLFSILGYLSYQAQVASNLTSNGFLIQASQIQSNINSAYILLTDNISNICIAKGFINCNIIKPQLIPNLNTNSLNLGSGNISNVNNINTTSITTNQINLNSKVITTLALKDIDNFIQTQYGTYYDITNGSLAINATPNQSDFFSVGGQTTIQGELIAEGKIKENSLYLNDVYITSNQVYYKQDVYSIEREYPPQIYNSVSAQTTTTFLGKTVYTETLTLNTAPHGNGNYILYSSSVYTGRNKYLCFDKNIVTYAGWAFNYFQPDGYYAYNGSNVNSYIEDSYKGDWVIIKFPSPLILTRYKFRHSTAPRAPALFRFYGSMDGINFTEIVEASNDTIPLVSGDYPSSIYEKILNTSFNIPYLYIGFCCNKLVGGDSTASTMLLQEFYIYGKEKIEVLTLPIYISSNAAENLYINSNIFFNIIPNYITSNQIYKKTDTYSIEQQYPQKLYDSFTPQIATTFLGQASYQESITLNNVGKYDIYVSTSSLNGARAGKQLFNYVLNEEADSCHFTGGYNASGFYVGTADYINSGYYGDWVVIKLPNPIILTKFAFYMRPLIPTRAPSLWKCYGSIDGITFTEIVEGGNTTALTSGNYTANKYEKILNTTFNTPYTYIGFCYNKIIGSGGILNFSELQIFGKELLETPIYVSSNVLKSILSSYSTTIDTNSNINVYINTNNSNTSNYINTNVSSLYNYINLNNTYTSNFINSNNINTSNYLNTGFVNMSNLCANINTNTSNFIRKTNVLLPNTSFWYDYTNNLQCYDLNIEKYVPSINLGGGYKSRSFRITTYVPIADWRTGYNLSYNNQYINFPETLTIHMNNNSNSLGATSPNDAYANGVILGKTQNTNIGYWNFVPNNYNYIRYITHVGWETNIIIENLNSY